MPDKPLIIVMHRVLVNDARAHFQSKNRGSFVPLILTKREWEDLDRPAVIEVSIRKAR